MNTAKQFWTLLKFQPAINPFIWFALFAFISPLLFTFNSLDSYHPNLSSLLTVYNLFMMGLVGMWSLAPEMAQPRSTNVVWHSGTEFLLTRAIDRPVLYRSRAAYLYFLVLLIPVMCLLYSLQKPDLKVTEYSKLAQQECLNHVPGSTLEPNASGSRSPLISIPRGNVLVNEWYLWVFAVTALSVQVSLLLLYPLKHRLFIFYALFMAFVFVPIFFEVHDARAQTPSHLEQLFFFFTSHQLLFWILTALVFIFTQFWCERRFARLEQ